MNKEKMKGALLGAWQRIKRFYCERGVAAAVVTLLGVGFIAFLLGVLVNGSTAFMQGFFRAGNDMFMDYFNSVRDVAQGIEVYTEREVIYPPMANLIMLIFSRFMPKAYLETVFLYRESWVRHPAAIFSLLLYLGIPALLLCFLSARAVKKGKKMPALFGMLVLFSFPVLYMLERGNILIWSVLAVLYYALYYDSEKPLQRELALLALAFAFSLKLYPALLGWLLVADKRYKDAIRCAIYAILLLVLPSFFFGGPQCFIWIYQNITGFSSDKHSFWTDTFFPSATGGVASLIDNLPFLICIAIFLVMPFFEKSRARVMAVGVAALYAYPALNSLYAWSFFLAPLALYFGEERPKLTDWLLIAAMALPFTMLPGLAWLRRSELACYAFLGVLAVSVAHLALAIYRFVRARREKTVTE